MSASTTQMTFKLKVELRRPLLAVETVKAVLDCSEDDVIGWITDGTIEWAWDLRAPEAERAFVRAWAPSVDFARRAQNGESPERSGLAHRDVIRAVFKHGKPIIRASELVRVWNCGSDHVNNLIRLGVLSTIKPRETYYQRETPVIHRESLEAFMLARRIA